MADFISSLNIKNFKSIKDLTIPCNRINVFIGEPNTGKSNILEALGLLSYCGHSFVHQLYDFVRYHGTQNLFYDDILDEPIQIGITRNNNIRNTIHLEYKGNNLELRGEEYLNKEKKADISISKLNFQGVMVSYNEYSQLSRIKYYKFKRIEEFQPRQSTALEPPNGDNLFFSIYGNARCRELVTDIVKSAGYEIVFRPQQKAFEFQKRTGNTIVAYPYVLLSDTFQRVIFYSVAIETNKNAILAFEEPESHAFPYYTKFLGEKIARDEDNQYFIATHNPYLLNAIIAKGKQDSINIFKTTFKDYQTRVELLSKEKVAGLSDIDPFIAIGDI